MLIVYCQMGLGKVSSGPSVVLATDESKMTERNRNGKTSEGEREKQLFCSANLFSFLLKYLTSLSAEILLNLLLFEGWLPKLPLA